MEANVTAAVGSVLAVITAVLVVFNNPIMVASFIISMAISLYMLYLVKRQQKMEKQYGIRVLSWTRSARTAKSRASFVVALAVSLLIPVVGTLYAAMSSNLGPYTLYASVISFGMGMTFLFNFTNLPLALYHKSREKKIHAATALPIVSVIVPAYNEELLIRRTLESLVECDYPSKEIILIDDGSKDRTFQIAHEFATQFSNSQGCKVIVAKKENGGKASAINFAMRFATGEVLVVVDADSIVGRDALREMVKHFQNPGVVAVGGNIKVLNRWNVITRCQALEYIVGINLLKRAFDIFGVVMIIPGALGAFRKEILLQRGNYDTDTLTEDFDATIKTLKSGSSVQASSDALSYTEAPTTIQDLYKQRIRWNRGNLQTMLKHKDVMKNGKFGMLHDYGFPAVFLTMIVSPFLGMVVTAFIILALLNGLWLFVVSAFILFTCLQIVLSVLAMQMDGDSDWKLLLYSPLFVIGYKQLMDFFMVKSILDVLFDRKMKWTSAKRSGVIRKEEIVAAV